MGTGSDAREVRAPMEGGTFSPPPEAEAPVESDAWQLVATPAAAREDTPRKCRLEIMGVSFE
jgi:hypothetical protein